MCLGDWCKHRLIMDNNIMKVTAEAKVLDKDEDEDEGLDLDTIDIGVL